MWCGDEADNRSSRDEIYGWDYRRAIRRLIIFYLPFYFFMICFTIGGRGCLVWLRDCVSYGIVSRLTKCPGGQRPPLPYSPVLLPGWKNAQLEYVIDSVQFEIFKNKILKQVMRNRACWNLNVTAVGPSGLITSACSRFGASMPAAF